MANKKHKMTRKERIIDLYFNKHQTVSIIIYRTKYTQDEIQTVIDDYRQIHDKEQFYSVPQLNDLITGPYSYAGTEYQITGTITKKYTNSYRVDLTPESASLLPEELNGVVVISHRVIEVIKQNRTLDASNLGTLIDAEGFTIRPRSTTQSELPPAKATKATVSPTDDLLGLPKQSVGNNALLGEKPLERKPAAKQPQASKKPLKHLHPDILD